MTTSQGLISAAHPNERRSHAEPRIEEAPYGETDERPLVLVVEPTPDIAVLLCAALREAGLRAISVGTAAQALRVVAADHVQLAVVEIRLPDRHGVELAADLRARGIEVVLTSGHPEAINQGLVAGGVFLAKPFRLGELVATVLMLLPL